MLCLSKYFNRTGNEIGRSDYSGGKFHFPGRKIVSLQILRPEAAGFK